MAFDFLSFCYPWRSYQKRVLDELDSHLDDNLLHIVAAPGSGKTVLGLEVMRRLAKPTLIFAPNLTIRNQWKDRLIELFLPENSVQTDWITTDIHNPKLVTIITYQALYAVMSNTEEENSDGIEEQEEKTKINLTQSKHAKQKERLKHIIFQLHNIGIETLILDEAHHLRKEWWSALNQLIDKLGEHQRVSLTATPPYDVDYSEWLRYESLCGPIDAEISVPELVKNGDLCPHQDFIYFSLPEEIESKKLKEIHNNIQELILSLKHNRALQTALTQHKWVKNPDDHIEPILSQPKLFSAILIYLNYAGITIPTSCLNIIGVNAQDIPKLNTTWLETLLNSLLFPDTTLDNFHNHFNKNDIGYFHTEAFIELESHLKKIGAVFRRKVVLDNTQSTKKLLASSQSKLASILSITNHELFNLGDNLRQVILTDYIQKSDLPKQADDKKNIDKLGVVPIFELLRRAELLKLKLGVLTGSLVFIPKTALPALKDACVEQHLEGLLKVEPLIFDDNYLSVRLPSSKKQLIVKLVTEIFNKGEINTLVGTQALLGEGWDAPSINSLILASHVGSYMLSNQMRGRAIRSYPKQLSKTANIWHLVAVDTFSIKEIFSSLTTENSPQPRRSTQFLGDISEDIGIDMWRMIRRFKTFEGVSYNTPYIIENGLKRLALGPEKWNKDSIEQRNQNSLKQAKKRTHLKQKWDDAIKGSSPNPELKESVYSNHTPRYFLHSNTLKWLLASAFSTFGIVFAQSLRGTNFNSTKSIVLVLIIAFIAASLFTVPKLLRSLYLLFRNGSLEKSTKQVGYTVLNTLQHLNTIKTRSDKLRIVAKQGERGTVYCSLEGATRPERQAFLEAMQEVLGPCDDPRYLIKRESHLFKIRRIDYHPVPSIIGKQKSSALFFTKRWNQYIGFGTLVYTRSVEGRMTLLQARTQSLAASFTKKSERRTRWE